MMIFIVYKHTNVHNRKSYIGITSGDGSPHDLMMKRWKGHCYAARTGHSVAFAQAIKKYGEDSFTHDVLEVHELESDVLDAEIRLIADHKTYIQDHPDIGYNMTRGGENRVGENNPNVKLTLDDVCVIKTAWSSAKQRTGSQVSEFYKSYAEFYGVTADLICKIVNGKLWPQVTPELNNEVSYRGKNELVPEKLKMKWLNDDFRERESLKRRGVNNGMAILTEDDVRFIRDEFKTIDVKLFGMKSKFYRNCASKFGVTPNLICGIVNNKCWKHVT